MLLRPIKRAVLIAMAVGDRKLPPLLVPAANAHEVAVATEVEVFGVSSLSETVGSQSGQMPAGPVAIRPEDLAA